MIEGLYLDALYVTMINATRVVQTKLFCSNTLQKVTLTIDIRILPSKMGI